MRGFLIILCVLGLIAIAGCGPNQTNIFYPKDNLVVRDAHGNYYILKGNYQGANGSYFLESITNVTFSAAEK